MFLLGIIISIIFIISINSIISQVRNQMSIPDYQWTEKREKLAKTIDDLGDNFRPQFKAA